MEVGRFAEQSALLIVDNKTELVSTFDLSERGEMCIRDRDNALRDAHLH